MEKQLPAPVTLVNTKNGSAELYWIKSGLYFTKQTKSYPGSDGDIYMMGIQSLRNCCTKTYYYLQNYYNKILLPFSLFHVILIMGGVL